MAENKKACISGVTGQTGSFLAELLLDKGYDVCGLIRRSSTFNTARIDHLYHDPNLEGRLSLVYGDLSDYSSIVQFIEKVKPDEFYNMAAQSHVRVSFDIPEYTMDIDATGVIRCLEAIRRYSPETRFLQASTSELFGDQPSPQNEETPFKPRSPYACAKAAAYYATVNYREAYNLFAVNSITFNHECVSRNTPIIVRRNNVIDVCLPTNLIPLRCKGPNIQTYDMDGIEVWDGMKWTDLTAITATKKRTRDQNHDVLSIQARAGIVHTTKHHNMLDNNFSKIETKDLSVGGRLAMCEQMPKNVGWTSVNKDLAELLGYLAADGFVPSNRGGIQFTNNNEELYTKVSELWSKLFLGRTRGDMEKSGFTGERNVHQLYLKGKAELTEWFRNELYTKDGFKKVPQIILNATTDVQESFLDAYYAGDGLKKGKGDSFVTNSCVLAQGLILLYSMRGRLCSIYEERRNSSTYYRVNILKNSNLGAHWIKDPAEIRKIEGADDVDDWVFDLETRSGTFCAGVGRIVVHNSPRRGETFVTRKITRAAARIKLGLQKKLYLGNLDAKRDWSDARDVVHGMYAIATADVPKDYAIATGESRSVKEFLETVFSKLELDWQDYVEFDPKYLRPTEVPELCGDASKIKKELGWEPKYSFDDLVQSMIDYDMDLAQKEKVMSYHTIFSAIDREERDENGEK
jgi:GDPmannose 4,6-dehydratase